MTYQLPAIICHVHEGVEFELCYTYIHNLVIISWDRTICQQEATRGWLHSGVYTWAQPTAWGNQELQSSYFPTDVSTISLETTLADRIGDRCRGPKIRRFDPNPGVLISEWRIGLGSKHLLLNLYICPQYDRLELFPERLCMMFPIATSEVFKLMWGWQSTGAISTGVVRLRFWASSPVRPFQSWGRPTVINVTAYTTTVWHSGHIPF